MKTYWRTQTGHVIDVDDMDINHLRNAFKMLIRNMQPKKKEFKLNGDMAQQFNDTHPADEDDPILDEMEGGL